MRAVVNNTTKFIKYLLKLFSNSIFLIVPSYKPIANILILLSIRYLYNYASINLSSSSILSKKSVSLSEDKLPYYSFIIIFLGLSINSKFVD